MSGILSFSGASEHFSGVPAGNIGNLHTAKHTGNFLDTRVCIERINTAVDAIALKMFSHLPLPFSTSRYLR